MTPMSGVTLMLIVQHPQVQRHASFQQAHGRIICIVGGVAVRLGQRHGGCVVTRDAADAREAVHPAGTRRQRRHHTAVELRHTTDQAAAHTRGCSTQRQTCKQQSWLA